MATKVPRIHKQTRPRVWHLGAWMRFKGLTDLRLQARLEELGLEVDRVTLTRWRNETRYPKTLEQLPAIAHALGVETWQLFTLPPVDGRPSIDAVLKDAPPEVAQKIADLVALWKTGS